MTTPEAQERAREMVLGSDAEFPGQTFKDRCWSRNQLVNAIAAALEAYGAEQRASGVRIGLLQAMEAIDIMAREGHRRSAPDTAECIDAIEAALAKEPKDRAIGDNRALSREERTEVSEALKEKAMSEGPWYVGAQNDELYIIDQPPRPSNDDINPDRQVNVIAKVYGPNADEHANLIVRAVAALRAAGGQK